MRALITGVAGQDGTYLAELLLEKGYEVFGSTRDNNKNYKYLPNDVELVDLNLSSEQSVTAAVREIRPNEIYNFASPSFIPESWNNPEETADIIALGTLRLLEAIRIYCPDARFLQASSSEIFGDVQTAPQNEETSCSPRSPYASAKLFAFHVVRNYRTRYELFACSSISFNHESLRRDLRFVTRKVTHGVAKIKLGLAPKLLIGDLGAQRDWGFAGDYVRGMWLMIRNAEPQDFVLATGKLHSVRDLVARAFSCVGLSWELYTEVDSSLVRPCERVPLVGNPKKANMLLNWHPTVSFENLIEEMVNHDLIILKDAYGTPASEATMRYPNL